MKYYTNIDIEGETPETVYDFMINNDLLEDLWKAVEPEHGQLMNIAFDMRSAVRHLYDAEHSLSTIVKKVLSGDIDLQNAETRELIEKLIDMQAAYQKQEDESRILQFGQKKTAQPVQAGGVKLSFKKK